MIWILVLAIAISILFSALLSAAESATLAIHPSRLRTLKDEGFRGAVSLAALKEQPDKIKSSILFLNTIFNGLVVGLSVMIGAVNSGMSGGFTGLIISTLVVAALCEIFPRSVGKGKPIRIALKMAKPMLSLQGGIDFFVTPMHKLLLPFLTNDKNEASTQEERSVRELTQLGQREGLVGEEEHLLVERAFHLDELTAWDIMTPRVDIFAWPDSLSLEDIIGELSSVPYSRIPVFGETTDDITGILYIREAYQTYVAGMTDLTLAQLSRDPLFLPGSLSLTSLLRQFQGRRIHMGIIADEFGGTDGLVTLEDILEELVGEIEDETDVAEAGLSRLSRTEFMAPASIDLREINYAFNLTLPQLDHRSLNGFILAKLGHVPTAGETFETSGVLIEILEASETQVILTRLTKLSLQDRDHNS
jgi:CBS domain containing-hemolysin-like protein